MKSPFLTALVVLLCIQPYMPSDRMFYLAEYILLAICVYIGPFDEGATKWHRALLAIFWPLFGAYLILLGIYRIGQWAVSKMKRA